MADNFVITEKTGRESALLTREPNTKQRLLAYSPKTNKAAARQYRCHRWDLNGQYETTR